MLFNKSCATTSLLALVSLSNASALKKFRRASESDVNFYCYGSSANGAAIWYADGYAYFGGGDNIGTLNGSVSTAITFTIDDSDTTVPWTIQPNSSTVSFNSTKELYIIPTDGSFAAVGFAASTDLPTGGVSTGFAFMGTNVAYAQSDSNYELMFWGANTTVSGIFGLYWNQGSSSLPEGAFPVTVKTTAPVKFSQ